MSAFDRVQAILHQHDIDYAVIGAAALAAHGVARSSFDIDVLTMDARVFDTRLWAAFKGEADIRRGDSDDPLAGVVRIASDEEPVDIIVGKHQWQRRAVERAERVGGGPPIALARDLVLLKLYAGGSQDAWDIRELLKSRPASLVDDVEADLTSLPDEMRQRWRALHI